MADTATPAKTASTANVAPQDRGFDSDYEHTVNFSMPVGSATRSWFPKEKIRITRITMSNGDVAQAASTNTTALDIDSEDNAGAKVADIAPKAANLAVAIDVGVELVLSTTEADLVIEDTETVKIAATIAGTQGEFDVAVSYKKLEVRDVPGVWPAA